MTDTPDETGLSKSAGGEVATEQVDDFLGGISIEDYATGFNQNVNASSEIQIGRGGILQPGSPEIAGEQPGYSIGMIVDTFDRSVISKQVRSPWLKGIVPDEDIPKVHALLIVPCFKLPTEYIKWKDRDTEGTGWHFKTLDVKDPRVAAGIWPASGGSWGTQPDQEGAPPVTENCNYFCMVLDPEDPERLVRGSLVITFAKTSFKAGKTLTTHIERNISDNSIPAHGRAYYVWVKKEKNEEKNSFFCYLNVAVGPDLILKHRDEATGKVSLKPTTPALGDIARQGATWFKKFKNSPQLQEVYINAAQEEALVNTVNGEGGWADESSTVDGSTVSSTIEGGEEDTEPF